MTHARLIAARAGTTGVPLQGKRAAVLAFARQGRALARWLPTVGAQVVVSDGKTAEQLGIEPAAFPGVEFMLGGHPANLLDGVDVLCVSGGVPNDNPIVLEAVQRGITLTNDAQLFMERCPAPVIGITGSAGKTTTTTLVGAMLKRAGLTTWVGGNIGDVLLDVLGQIRPNDRVVMELSSFQLELMTASPEIGAVLNITPNHLDRHGTMEAYAEAKARLLAYQDDSAAAILGRDDAGSRALEDCIAGRLAWFSMREMVADGAFLAGERLILSGISSPDGGAHAFAERGDLRLRGEHNLANVLAACAITGAAGVKPEAMLDVIRAFRGVPHRMEIVRERGGVTFVNDSIATAPERVLAALRSYDEPLVLLLGGRDKKLPWEEMMTVALRKARLIVAFGEAADLVARVARAVGAEADQVVRAGVLDEALALAVKAAQPGDVVLLSPGGTSYDAYEDFAQRGEHFRQLVLAL